MSMVTHITSLHDVIHMVEETFLSGLVPLTSDSLSLYLKVFIPRFSTQRACTRAITGC